MVDQDQKKKKNHNAPGKVHRNITVALVLGLFYWTQKDFLYFCISGMHALPWHLVRLVLAKHTQ